MLTRLRDDLKTAMKSRDRLAVSVLRSALAAIANAEAVGVTETVASHGSEHVAGAALGVGAAEAERRRLTEADIRGIVAAEVAERTTAADEYDKHDRPDDARKLRAEAEVLGRYLSA
ncbi:MAG TPA: GatB/YqeY domain-containing protein [Stackebrandtia sp.]|jgi:uncharacterized protein YqeY|uniref:GatB/YqeY domain-containing protein n=1 Tax=Stackebrandtia sp. TaxID=2023065 RepID=UPI002D762120|nr:GatB/YqeY domain-containing protein [Stackebrandtia sp.]HZE41383.1 GatB/YqeY domain-containing protein [Stackebrandtia sp.]